MRVSSPVKRKPDRSRKLVAVMCADVVGYARLMQRDEVATHARIKELASGIVRCIEENNGRLVKSMGDGFLMEFGSVSSAVSSGFAIQEQIAEKNAGLRDDDRVLLRIGVHVGDVIVDGDDIFGDGVIVASRLEGLAAPGGMLVSKPVYGYLNGEVTRKLVSMGNVDLKNLDTPMKVWQWLPESVAVAPPERPVSSEHRQSSRPSVAVLRFLNLSNNEEQEYLVRGICDDLQSSLSKSQLFRVVARNSSFSFDPNAIDPQQVGRSLNARYIIQGSVRTAGPRIRVNASLVDTTLATEVWSDKFDGEIEDVFDLQDQMTAALTSAIIPEITRAEIERTRKVRVGDLSAWDHYLQSVELMQKMTENANREAISHLHRVLDLDAEYSSAWAMLSRCHITAVYQLWGDSEEEELKLAIDSAHQAIDCGPTNPLGYDAKAAVHIYCREFPEAILSAQAALKLDPSLTSAYSSLATALAFTGKSEEALEICLQADHISPRDLDRSQRQMAIIIANFVSGNYEITKQECQRYVLIKPNWFGVYTFLAASCAFLGELEEAGKAVSRLLDIIPGYTRTKHEDRMWLQRESDRQRLLEGLELAGLP
ncbi:adenylate/guanylate cyclase domain-containing protein [Sulfitobacter sp. HNIBRBA3233]|uniref:adenylate/guanylate cyclase domain-containing protein n=1 Tax=Sulfitobacter marinivivus TaxID=3158558 RepID=UPI0032E04D79